MPIFRVKSVKIYTCQKNLHLRRRPRRRQLSGMLPSALYAFFATYFLLRCQLYLSDEAWNAPQITLEDCIRKHRQPNVMLSSETQEWDVITNWRIMSGSGNTGISDIFCLWNPLQLRCETCGDCFTKRYFLISHAMTVHQVGVGITFMAPPRSSSLQYIYHLPNPCGHQQG